MPKTDALHTTQ